MHLGSGAGVEHAGLASARFPTGRTSVEEVLRLALRSLGVDALREDWPDVLDETQGAYEAWRTWPSPN